MCCKEKDVDIKNIQEIEQNVRIYVKKKAKTNKR